MTQSRLQELLDRHTRQLNTAEEEDELMSYIANSSSHEDILVFLNQFVLTTEANKDMDEESAAEILQSILCAGEPLKSNQDNKIYILSHRWIKYAAAILLILSTAAVFYFVQQPGKEKQITQTIPASTGHQQFPGNRAVLTLSDGRQIELNNAASETINDGNLSIENNKGELIYRNNGVMARNTMTTPRGAQYQLTLADGTRVWLNAGSSITYPTAFTNKSREVSITGEAYFDVATNATQPFRVITRGNTIEVLGTEFNVNAYSDEDNITTALITGSVNIKTQNTARKLSPGQVAEITGGTHEINIVRHARLETITAWKEGISNFNNKSLQSIMRQLSRWYDVEVIYSGVVPEKQFWGEMGMDVKLEDVLEFLKKSNVKFIYQPTKKLITVQ